jgi:hypothetical protein
MRTGGEASREIAPGARCLTDNRRTENEDSSQPKYTFCLSAAGQHFGCFTNLDAEGFATVDRLGRFQEVNAGFCT